MFGPGTATAIETYKNAHKEQTLKALLVLFGCMESIISAFKVDGDNVSGYDAAGKELIKVPITEPLYIREFYDAKLNTYRQNTP
jgi:nitrate reductase beta subunit